MYHILNEAGYTLLMALTLKGELRYNRFPSGRLLTELGLLLNEVRAKITIIAK